jgi:hypothetical protein
MCRSESPGAKSERRSMEETMTIPVGLNVWSRLVTQVIPYLDQVPPAVAGQAVPMGFQGGMRFVMNETTSKALVGPHKVDAIEPLGAHTAGENSEGKQTKAGVFTKEMTSFDKYHKVISQPPAAVASSLPPAVNIIWPVVALDGHAHIVPAASCFPFVTSIQ